VAQLSAVIYLADCAAHLAGPSPGASDASAVRPSPTMAELLGLKQDKVEQMITRLHGAMKSVNQYLSVA
jgi:hypothetical protein